MKIKECIDLIDAKLIVPAENMDADIQVACGADLMSDVMAFACSSNDMMITGLVNLQTIRTAEMMDAKVVVFVRGKMPDQTMCDLARQKSICLMNTTLPMFTTCGKLYAAGIKGKGDF